MMSQTDYAYGEHVGVGPVLCYTIATMKDQSTSRDFFARLGELFAAKNSNHQAIVAGIIAILAGILLVLSYYQ